MLKACGGGERNRREETGGERANRYGTEVAPKHGSLPDAHPVGHDESEDT